MRRATQIPAKYDERQLFYSLFACSQHPHSGWHVVGILDWEIAGGYREYWEWCKTLWAENWEMVFVIERVPPVV